MANFNITIDARELFIPSFIIPGVTAEQRDARSLQTLELGPGSYSYQVQAGVFADFTFTVTPDGTIDYDPGFDAFLDGRGTSTLVLKGFEVTVDARGLTGADNGGGVVFAATFSHEFIDLRTVRLLPQTLYMVQQSSGRVADLAFALTRIGTFSYDSALDVSQGGCLSGAGTSTLKFVGHTIAIDARAVSRLLVVQPIVAMEPSFNGMATIVVLPAASFLLQLDRGVTDLEFSVGITGTVTVDPTMTDLLEVLPGDVTMVRVLPHQVFTSPIYGLTYVKGQIYEKWQMSAAQTTFDGQNVATFIGTAVENVQTVEADRPYIVQRFERGMVVDVQGRKQPFVIYGGIALRYRYLADVQSGLGAPITDEVEAAGGGRAMTFENGVIHWRADLGAHETHGAILERWNALGGPSGLLGYPISDELPVMQNGNETGRVSRFEPLPRDGQAATVGAIYWSPATGAFEIFGPIFTAWLTDFGGPGGMLGFPTSGQTATPNGQGRLQTFERGLVVWHADRGAFPVIGGIVLNLFSFTVSQASFNVQVDVTSQTGAGPGPSGHGRIPSDGEFDPGQQDFPPQALVTIDKVTPDLVINVNQMEAISENVIGSDDIIGNVAPIVYNIDNVWGLNETSHFHANGGFQAVLAVQPLNQVTVVKDFRKQLFWPFHNFDTDSLSWNQYEATFRDVAEVDKHISFIPPRMHFGEIAVYESVYKRLAEGGNCFGMCLEAIYARERRSLFNEPIFSTNSYRKDGQPLVGKGEVPAPDDAEVADVINVKMGYQIGSEQIGWFLGKWSAGALHDPVRAFRESRDAYARGDWPILTLSDKDKLSTDGHVVLPYAWNPSTEEEIASQPLSGQTWRIFVANPNEPAAGGAAVPDNAESCVIVIDPFQETWHMKVKADEPPWSGSSQGGGRLLTMPYSLLSHRPTSPADLLANLLEMIAAGALIVFAGDDRVGQITDSKGRTLFASSADGTRRINFDPATRIPDLALLPKNEQGLPPHDMLIWRPDPGTAGTQLLHQLQGGGNYTWSLISPALSMTSVVEGVVPGETSGDQIVIDELGTAQQTVAHIVPPGGNTRTLHVSVAGWPGSDLSKAKWFEMTNFTASPGHIIRAQVLNAGRTLSLHNDGPSATFDLAVHSGLDADPVAVRTGVRMPAGKAWQLEPADWAMAGTPLGVAEMDKIGGSIHRQFRM